MKRIKNIYLCSIDGSRQSLFFIGKSLSNFLQPFRFIPGRFFLFNQ